MAQNVSDKLIGSLAIFKSDLVEKDFISSYIPFVATALLSASKVEGSIDIRTVSEHFEALFGFCIDRAPMTTILNHKAGLGLRERKERDHIADESYPEAAVCAGIWGRTCKGVANPCE